MSPTIIRIVSGLVILIGIGIAKSGFPAAHDSWASSDWPTTEGRLTRSDIEDTSLTGTLAQRKRQRGSPVRYRHVVLYHYAVDGVEYDGNRKDFDDGYSDTPVMETDDSLGSKTLSGSGTPIKQRWSVGNTVTIYYKPDDPAVSVLVPGFRARACFWFIGGLMAVFFGAIGLLFGRSPSV